jgi:hypothetical protein
LGAPVRATIEMTTFSEVVGGDFLSYFALLAD